MAILLLGLGNPLACLLHSALSDVRVVLYTTANQAPTPIEHSVIAFTPPVAYTMLAHFLEQDATDCLPCYDHETASLFTIAVLLNPQRVMPLMLPFLPWRAIDLFLRPITYPPPRQPPRRLIG